MFSPLCPPHINISSLPLLSFSPRTHFLSLTHTFIIFVWVVHSWDHSLGLSWSRCLSHIFKTGGDNNSLVQGNPIRVWSWSASVLVQFNVLQTQISYWVTFFLKQYLNFSFSTLCKTPLKLFSLLSVGFISVACLACIFYCGAFYTILQSVCVCVCVSFIILFKGVLRC